MPTKASIAHSTFQHTSEDWWPVGNSLRLELRSNFAHHFDYGHTDIMQQWQLTNPSSGILFCLTSVTILDVNDARFWLFLCLRWILLEWQLFQNSSNGISYMFELIVNIICIWLFMAIEISEFLYANVCSVWFIEGIEGKKFIPFSSFDSLNLSKSKIG